MVVVTTRGLFSVAAVKISSALVSSREREGISQVEQTSLHWFSIATRGATSSDMSHLLLLGKFEYTGGPIFKVVLEC